MFSLKNIFLCALFVGCSAFGMTKVRLLQLDQAKVQRLMHAGWLTFRIWDGLFVVENQTRLTQLWEKMDREEIQTYNYHVCFWKTQREKKIKRNNYV